MSEANLTPPIPGASTAAARAVPGWHLHRRMYDWMLSFSHKKYADVALFLFSFCEAIFFPIPPFVLQIPMTLERRAKAWWYAFNTTVGSVVGGLVGYWIGALFTDWVREHFVSEKVLTHFQEYSGNVWLLTGGAIAVHPFKIYAIIAGIFRIDLGNFVIAAAVGRGLLFFGIGAMLWWFGPPVKNFIEKYFNLLTVVFGVAIIGLVVLFKFL